jgi:hypothetical protein
MKYRKKQRLGPPLSLPLAFLSLVLVTSMLLVLPTSSVRTVKADIEPRVLDLPTTPDRAFLLHDEGGADLVIRALAKEDGRGIFRARMQVFAAEDMSSSYELKSDAFGWVRLGHIPPGEYVVIVSSGERQPWIKRIQLTAHQRCEHRFELERTEDRIARMYGELDAGGWASHAGEVDPCKPWLPRFRTASLRY